MKVMKAMKATSAKRKVVKPLGKGSTKKPLGKGTKPMKSILKPNNLRKLGQLTLAERVQQISSTAEEEEEAAQELQQSMTPAEKSRTWSKHQTHLNQPENKDEKEAYDKASKSEKGHMTALFLMRPQSSAMSPGPLGPSRRSP